MPENGPFNESIQLQVKIPNVTENASLRWTTEERQIFWWFIAEMVFCVMGIIANLLLLLAVFIYKPLRQSSSALLIAHCLLIDLYTCAVPVPFNAIPLHLGPAYRQSDNYCRFAPLWVYLVYPAEAWAALVLAIHRLVATVSPVNFQKFKSKTAMTFMLALPWFVTLSIVSFQVQPGARYKVIPAETGGCRFFVDNKLAAFASATLGTYFPVTMTGVCYGVFLGKTVFDSQRRGGRSSALHRRLEISRMLMLSFLWHFITLIPSVIVTSAFSAAYGSNLGLRLGFKFLLDSFSEFNPIFCLAASTLFQNGVKEVLGGRWCIGVKRKRSVYPLSQGTQGSILRRPDKSKAGTDTVNSKEATGSA